MEANVTRLTEIETKMIEKLKIKEIEWSETRESDTKTLNRLVRKGYAEKVTYPNSFRGLVWRIKK
jgi:hypothetical protein